MTGSADKSRTTNGRGRLYDGGVVDTIGDTPAIRVRNLAPDGVRVYVKAELFNPGGSVKDRLAISIIEEAEKKGWLKPGGTIVENTSGNTAFTTDAPEIDLSTYTAPVAPSNSASAHSSRGKCAGTQSSNTPIPAWCRLSTRRRSSSGWPQRAVGA